MPTAEMKRADKKTLKAFTIETLIDLIKYIDRDRSLNKERKVLRILAIIDLIEYLKMYE